MAKRQIKKIEIIFFFSIFLEGISIFTIGSFPVSVPFILSLILLGIFFIKSFGKKKSKKRTKIGMSLLFVLIASSILSRESINFTSIALYMYYILFFLYVDSYIDDSDFIRIIPKFIKIATICAVYGIYQFIAYNFVTVLPLKELIPSVLLTPGYNTVSKAYLAGYTLYRAHSIYLESSFFSQYSAIVLLLIISTFGEKKYKINHKITLIGINSIALLLSLSGTGILILLGGLLYLVIKSKKRKQIILVLTCSFLLVFALITALGYWDSIYSYYMRRVTEVNVKNGYGSGYYRIIMPILAIFYVARYKFFGFGAGNDDILAQILNSPEHGIPNGFGKIVADLGIIGIVIFVLLLLYFKPKKRSDCPHKLLFLILLLLLVCGSSFVLVSFWTFSMLLKPTKRYTPVRRRRTYEGTICLQQ